ncbi:hypothetical protein [Shinella sp.]|uniref:hypothetical protein n=1 Tax=Shinella sp. TaxID=1870904 RepID=UPI0040370AD6
MKNIARFLLFVNASLKGNFTASTTAPTTPSNPDSSHEAPSRRHGLLLPNQRRTEMQDMYGLAILFELSQKDGRHKHEFDHLRETPPLRTRFFRFLRAFRLSKTVKGPE